MIKPRVIPIILLDDGKVVKGTQFSSHLYVGDPVNVVKVFNDLQADELILVDINARQKNTSINSNLKSIVENCFMPVTYIGGISTYSEVSSIFDWGVEKIGFNFFNYDPYLVKKTMSVYGKQSLSVILDLKYSRFHRRYLPYDYIKKRKHKLDEQVISEQIENDFGELILQNVTCEGTFSGCNLEKAAIQSYNCSIPTILTGGIGSVDNIISCFQNGADGVAVGSFFTYASPQRGVLISYLTDSDFHFITSSLAK